jgi:large subunit ribosomal protein L25
MQMKLTATTRQLLGKRSRRLHAEGKLAGVVYGHNTSATPLVLDRMEFQKVFSKAGRTHLVDLVVDGDRAEKVLVREIQTHPRRQGPIHVDLYKVNLEEKISVEVPVHLIGESNPVKAGDADILQPIHLLNVECLPTDIPESFEVDITVLEEIEAEIRVSDLKVPKGVTILDDAEELVVKIVHKRELKIEEEAPVAGEVALVGEGEEPAEGEAPAAEGTAETKARGTAEPKAKGAAETKTKE